MHERDDYHGGRRKGRLGTNRLNVDGSGEGLLLPNELPAAATPPNHQMNQNRYHAPPLHPQSFSLKSLSCHLTGGSFLKKATTAASALAENLLLPHSPHSDPISAQGSTPPPRSTEAGRC